MFPRFPRLALAVLVFLAAAAGVSIRQVLVRVPRIRVGPLRTEVPAKPAMRFFALGGTGTGGDDQLKVAAAMEERCRAHGADGIFLLGDNASPAGFVSVDDSQWQGKVQGPYGSSCLKDLPIYAVLGAQDYAGSPGAEVEYSLINSRWHMPNRFYSVAFGGLVKLIAFDSNVTDICLKPAFCGVDFLLDSLEGPPATWTLVMAYHPLASASDRGLDYRGGVRGMLLKPYLCGRIDGWIAGQDRHLEIRQPPGCRMQLFVSGAGGDDLGPTRPPDGETPFVRSQHGFLELEVTAAELTSRFISDAGAVLYEGTRAARR